MCNYQAVAQYGSRNCNVLFVCKYRQLFQPGTGEGDDGGEDRTTICASTKTAVFQLEIHEMAFHEIQMRDFVYIESDVFYIPDRTLLTLPSI